MTMVGWIIDAVLLIMLLGAIFIGNRIQRRLCEVRAAQDELADLVLRLDGATEKAQASVGELRKAGGQARDILSGEMGKARALADELGVMVAAGDNLADRLDGKIGAAKQRARQTAPSPVAGKPPPRPVLVQDSRSIFEAIRDAR